MFVAQQFYFIGYPAGVSGKRAACANYAVARNYD